MTVLIIVIVALAGLVLWLFTLPGQYQVQRSVRVRAALGQSFEAVRDFQRWPSWSPWLLHDPACELHYENPREQGGYYRWDSALIGQGRVSHQTILPEQQLQMLLEFFKPFKSQAQVSFDFCDVGDGYSEIHWTMDARLPLVMRPMRKMFETMIGLDFELGLALLAGQLDPSAEHPRLEFVGLTTRPAQTLLTQSYNGALSAMGKVMADAYPALAAKAGAAQSGPPLALYHKVRPNKDWVECQMAVPVQETTPGSEPLPEGQYFLVRAYGDYRFLKLSWHSAYGHLKMKKIKYDAKRPGLEVYPNDPLKLPNSNDWLTELYLPVR